MSSITTMTARCGHTYAGYPFTSRPRCPACVAQHACEIDATNAARLVAEDAQRPAKFKPTRARRLRLYERDRWLCQLCFEPVDPTVDPESDMAASLDHIVCVSWVEEPDHSDANLRLAHRRCNRLRGDEGRWLSTICAS